MATLWLKGLVANVTEQQGGVMRDEGETRPATLTLASGSIWAHYYRLLSECSHCRIDAAVMASSDICGLSTWQL